MGARPGARASDYPDVAANARAQLEYHEQRIGRKVDIAHTYSSVGSVPLSSEYDKYLAKRADTYLFANWKPAAKWKDAGGGNSTINARIDKAAANIKALGSKKIFLTLHHEPENDTSSASGCAVKPGSYGTPTEYRQMWKNVRERFDAKGVTNVVWVMDYMNYKKWDCLVPKLYPGDQYVDWIMFNAYGQSATPNFVTNVDRFMKVLSANNMTSRPMGIVEWGVYNASQSQARSYYEQAAKALSDNRFPNIKAYMIFDSMGVHNDIGLRIRYDDKGNIDNSEQAAYAKFANSPLLSQS